MRVKRPVDKHPVDETSGLTVPRRGPGRAWLLAPLVLAAVAAAVWCGSWVFVSHRIQAGLDDAVAAHQADGRTLTWERRSVGGFPFRHSVSFEGARFASPSGWALEAPRLEAQANAYQLTHWVASAPQGLTLVRPQGGAVRITGRPIRASLSAADQPIPRVAVEGVGLAFAPAPGAEPFYFTAAERLEIHLRPDPATPTTADFVVRLRQATPPAGGLIGFVSTNRPADIVWESELRQFPLLRADTWAEAVRRWTDRGGELFVNNVSVKAGDVAATVQNGVLRAGLDGRLRGRLDLQLNRPLQALGALGRTEGADPTAIGAATAVAQARGASRPGAATTLPLVFEAGMMTIGPVSLGEAPRVY